MVQVMVVEVPVGISSWGPVKIVGMARSVKSLVTE
ncbi:MAG: hypothetical protein BWY77_00684 [bacterium ADurb.Bin431]|nr:MAG: hypothetical protein BWY77_00684 [bacterium ADurb.Bin431]